MRVASVIVDVSARAVDRAFDYSVPSQLAAVSVGCAVAVEFGTRPVVGYVVAVGEKDLAPEQLKRLKPLTGILSQPYFDEQSARLAAWIAREYAAPLSECVRLVTPPGGTPKIKRIDGSWQLVRPGVGPVDDRWVFLTPAAQDYTPPKNAVKQQAVLEALACGGMRMAELCLQVGAAHQTCKALEKRGMVRIEQRRRMRDAMTATAGRACERDKRKLTAQQQEALAAVQNAMGQAAREGSLAGPSVEPSGINVVVIDGITGSGKTEVYLQAIEACLDLGRSACVLIPEISLTPQTVGRFRARFGEGVAVLHSHLSAGERFDQWDLVRQGGARVVVGTRSSIFAPLTDLGLLIIDEEHEGSYKQDSSPRYDAREVAIKLCELRGAALVLGSATPRLETLAQCQRSLGHGVWSLARMTERPTGQALPQVDVVDMGKEFRGGSRCMFSQQLLDALTGARERGEKSVLLLNKRGFANFVLCRDCGFVPECSECSVSLTYHERGNKLACHHCGHEEPLPAKCPKCGSPYLRKFGAGTQRVEDELRAVMPPGTPIIRMDADTTSTKGAHERLLEEFASTPAAVLLGTQMIAKGLDFPEVTVVGVINADTTLKLPDYRSGERTYQLLEQVSGRAGRGSKPGRVIVQTYCPDHPAVLAAANHDRSLIVDYELPLREELGYPPYKRLANLLVWGKNAHDVQKAALELGLAINAALESGNDRWTVLGPAPCALERLKGDTRWHILLKAEPGEDFGAVLGPLLAKRRKTPGIKVAVDVDPGSLA